jgi:CubicO group peptidase (beta-lactamase class C family)
MPSNDDVRAPIGPTDPILQYLGSRPLPIRTEISPVDVSAALNQLDDAANLAARDTAGKRWVPGLAIVVVGRGGGGTPDVLYCKGHGVKSVDGGALVGPDTLFPCASLSKPVSTTLVVAAGVPRTLGGWDTPVQQVGGGGEYTVVKPPSPPTTLRQWLSHRSGLPDHAGDLIEDMNPSMEQERLITCIMQHQTGIEPGAFEYTNAGFTMGCLGAAHAVAPGRRWEDAAATWLQELGMPRSTYRFTPASTATGDRVLPHQGTPQPPDLLNREPIGWTWRVVDRLHERNPTLQAPAGGLLSSARDLGHFLAAHLSGRFGDFPPRNPPPSDTTQGRSYSLGWNIANYSGEDEFKGARNAVSFSHSGAFTLGAGTCLRIDPDAGFGIAILSNGEPTGVPEALAALFFKYLYGQPLPGGCDHAQLFATCRVLMLVELYRRKIDNHERHHGKAVGIPGSIARGTVFEGYSDYYATKILIERRTDEDLILSMGNGPQGFPLWEIPLRCVDAAASTFVYATRGENEVGLSAIRLVWDHGVVVRIIDDWLSTSGPGLGEITRRQ